MRNPEVDRHIQLMYKYAKTLTNLVKSGEVTRESIWTSELVQAGAVKYLELIGEEAWQLTKAGITLRDVPLSAFANMRHRMVHSYEGIDWSVVEEATFSDVPELVESLRNAARRRGVPLE